VVTQSKLAVTAWFALRVTTQLPVPVQAPLHPWNVELTRGEAVRVRVGLSVDAKVQPSGSQVRAASAEAITPSP